jgi:hypothetical protein
VEIFRDSVVARNYDRAGELATAVADYEVAVIEKHHGKDLYRSKGKSRGQISFNDLTLEENLMYIKHDLADVQEAFHIFDITKGNYSGAPDLPASLIQKIATKTKKLDQSAVKIIDTNEYKAMLKSIQKNMGELSQRQFIDTVFALGKMHKKSDALLDKTSFFHYFIGDILKEVNKRVDNLTDSLEIAYLVKGLSNLNKKISADPILTQYENQVRENLLTHLNTRHELTARFDPYSVSKTLRYLLAYNDTSDAAIEVYKSFALLLT